VVCEAEVSDIKTWHDRTFCQIMKSFRSVRVDIADVYERNKRHLFVLHLSNKIMVCHTGLVSCVKGKYMCTPFPYAHYAIQKAPTSRGGLEVFLCSRSTPAMLQKSR
jgi:hypothetical protein